MLAITREMVNYEPDDSGLSSGVLIELGGPWECCTGERKTYVAEKPEDDEHNSER